MYVFLNLENVDLRTVSRARYSASIGSSPLFPNTVHSEASGIRSRRLHKSISIIKAKRSRVGVRSEGDREFSRGARCSPPIDFLIRGEAALPSPVLSFLRPSRDRRRGPFLEVWCAGLYNKKNRSAGPGAHTRSREILARRGDGGGGGRVTQEARRAGIILG